MTATLDRQSHRDALADRLADLRVQRNEALHEITPQGVGDDADRATNVDGHVKLALLEERIAAVENELATGGQQGGRTSRDTVDLGDVVTVDLGDGPETYLLGSVDAATDGVDVITPGSPLGRALHGSTAGTTVTYSPRPRTTLKAKIISVD